MSRPGLIIGLGGTGQWVLTWLKRDLLLSNNGQMPSNVRLLSIDTATQLEAGVRLVAGRQEEAVKVGDIRLEAGEFIYVGGDSRPLAEQVRKGERSNIGRWYRAHRWLKDLPPSVFVLDDGAGRIRQFGRIAIFKDILGQETNSRIWRALRNALEQVRRTVDEQRKLEIMVVGSFAGGTGSGMFLDVALILRLLAQQMGIHHVLRGFFALPSVFAGTPDIEMKARSFAAWRELNRFMVVDSDFPMPLIEYVEDNPTFRISPDQRIFDACYLVDNKRQGAAIATDAKYGVHPMVSEVISAILDEYAGTDYTQYIFTNLAPEYSRTPDVPLYSVLGSYNVQVPAHYKQEVSTLEFTKGILLKLLTPTPDTRKNEFVEAQSHLEIAAPDQNQEIGIGFAGRTRSAELLSTQSVTYEGETAKPTPFTGRIAEIIKLAVDRNQRPNLVNQLARAGGADARKGGVAVGWVGYFTNLGDDPQIAQLRKNVEGEVRYNMYEAFRRRDKQTADEVRASFSKIPEEMRRRYGGLTATGLETHGSFGDRLREAQIYHLALFRRLVRLHLLRMLMGASDQDPLRAKSGKLGFTWDYFDGLVSDFEAFNDLMTEVKRRREEIKPEIKLQGLSQNARRHMEQKADSKFLWWELPVVKRTEDAYLQAQQRLVDLLKEDLLHIYVVDTAQQMKEVCMAVRDTIQQWIWHLSTGNDAKNIIGLWSGVQSTLRSVNSDHRFDTSVPAVQRLVADQVPPVSDGDISAALRQWEWDASFADDSSRFALQARVRPDAAGDQTLTLVDPTDEVTPERRKQAAQQNQLYLTRLARRRFAGVAARTTVSDAIKELYPDSATFALHVAPGAEPLFEGTADASPRRKSNMIRVQTEPRDEYFYGPQGLEGVLRNEQNLDLNIPSDSYNIRVVNSENPYKLTLVRTDDLLEPRFFAAWQDCQNAYERHLRQDEGQPQDPILMHNFAAEAQAVVYEREFLESGTTYDPLHPRVVMLLEDANKIRQFIYLGMLGFISENNAALHRWELTWTRRNQPQTFWLTRGWNPETDRDNRPSAPDMMQALHGYVIRGRTLQPGRSDRIDYDLAHNIIQDELNKLGSTKERQMIEHNISGGLVTWLKSQAYDTDKQDTVLRKDLADLVKVVESMLRRRLQELDNQGQRTGWAPPSQHTISDAAVEKSKISVLVEDSDKFRQFIYLGLMGRLRPNEDSLGYRWELAWTKSGGEETYWLTPSWNSRTGQGKPQPNILDAMEGYIVQGRSMRPGDEMPLDYDFAEQLVQREQQQMGSAEEFRVLQQHQEGGFVAWLADQAFDPDVPGRVINQEFAELARHVEQMMQVRMSELSRRPSSSPASSNPFELRLSGRGSALPPAGNVTDQLEEDIDNTRGPTSSPFAPR